MSRLTKGTLIALIGTAFWSTTAIFISYLTKTYGMAPLQLALWRDALVCAGLAPVLFFIRRALLRLERRDMLLFGIYGLVLAVFNSMWAISVKYNGAAVATVLCYGSAGFTALLAWRIFHERLDGPKITAVILSLGGCVMVANAYDPAVWQLNPLGISVGLLSGLLFAIYSILGKETARRGINSWSALLFSFGSAVLFLLVFNFFPALPGAPQPGHVLPELPPAGWLALATLAFLPTIFGYGLYIVSMSYLPASIANLIATLEPVLTALWAYILLAEQLSLIQIIGGVMILSGVVIVRLTEKG